MPPDPNDGRIAALIRSISTGSGEDTNKLASALVARCWPGGVGDRTELIALEWVSRWGPARANTPRFECACASGQCSVCN